MAYMNKIQTPNNTEVNIADFRNAGVYYGTCATAAGTAAKVVSVTDARGSAFFELAAGAIIFIKFTYANTVQSAITLNVNSTGAKTVKYKNLTTKAPVWNAANETIGFTYDGTNFITIDPFEVGATISYGQVDSTSTATAFTATIPGITELADGVTMMLKNGVITSAEGFTININGLGAKPVYNNLAAATADTTIFNVNYTMLFIYDSTRVTGGCWICYRGYDSNSNTIGYQLRTNSTLRPAADKGYRYRLWFTSLDGHKWVPANTSSSTNATAKRTPNTRVIDPFGEIIYYSTNGTTEANADLGATTCWQQYAISLGYSFNNTGAALTLTNPAPVYIKCSPQSGGGVKMIDYTQTLPSTADGYVYLFLGMAYSATAIELFPNHPCYEYKDGAIRLWTNAAAGGSTVTASAAGTNGVQVGTITVDGTTTTLYNRVQVSTPVTNGITVATVTNGATTYNIKNGVAISVVTQTGPTIATITNGGTTYAVRAPLVEGLPVVSSADNGKMLRVVNAAWSVVTVPDANGVSF